MNTPIVAYYSQDGHSEKLAQAIGDALDFPVQPITEPIPATDLLYIVSGTPEDSDAEDLLNAIAFLDPATIKQAVVINSDIEATKSDLHMVRAVLESRSIPVLDREFVCKEDLTCVSMSHALNAQIDDAIAFSLKARDITIH